jgi:hypothetical protein
MSLNFKFNLRLRVLSSGLSQGMMEDWNNGFRGIDGMGYWENQVNLVILSNKYMSSFK